MCIVMAPAALLAISAGISAVGAIAQYSEAKSAADDATKSAQDSYNLQVKSVQEQQSQINQNAQDQQSQRAREATIERGRLKAIQGESGVMGNTEDRIMNESRFNEGSDIASIEGNRENAIKQSALDGQGLRANAQSRLNSIKQPSLIGTGLQIAGAGVQYEAGMNQLNRP